MAFMYTWWPLCQWSVVYIFPTPRYSILAKLSTGSWKWVMEGWRCRLNRVWAISSTRRRLRDCNRNSTVRASVTLAKFEGVKCDRYVARIWTSGLSQAAPAAGLLVSLPQLRGLAAAASQTKIVPARREDGSGPSLMATRLRAGSRSHANWRIPAWGFGLWRTE